MTHPYYLEKAADAITTAGGDPAVAGHLAAWAEAHTADDDKLSGVIVGEDGTILAETVRQGRMPSADYITDQSAARWGIPALERGLARGRIARAAGQQAVWIPRWRVTRGAPETGRMDADRFRGIREAAGLTIVDVTEMLHISRSMIQKWESGERPVPDGIAGEMERILRRYIEAVRSGATDDLTDRQARQVRVLHPEVALRDLADRS